MSQVLGEQFTSVTFAARTMEPYPDLDFSRQEI